MNEASQYGSHLDADQLAALAEGSLPEHERLQALAHMGTCVHCRETAFLAQEPVPVSVPAPVQASWREWLRQPWFWGGASAIAALALVLGAFLWTRQGPVQTNVSVAVLNKEQEAIALQPKVYPPVAASKSAPRARRENRLAPSKAAVTQKALRYLQASGERERVAAAPVAPPPASPAMMSQAASVRLGGANATAPPSTEAAQRLSRPLAAPPAQAVAAAPLPQISEKAPARSSSALSAHVEDLPLDYRYGMPQRAAKARAAAVGTLQLRIEHGAGADAGKAEVAGQVLDQSGAVIPQAVVRLTQPASIDGGSRSPAATSAEAVTDAAGRFTFPAVPAGKYQAQVSAPGFVSASQPLELRSRDAAQVDAMLAVSAASEAVAVDAATVQLGTVEAKSERTLPGVGNIATLPGGIMPVTTVQIGMRSVAVDAAGTVFTRHEGTRWKRMKAPWSGVATTLRSSAANAAATDASSAQRKPQSSLFEVTTSAGVVWVSADGKSWVQR